MQDVQRAEPLHGGADRCLQACLIGHVGAYGNRTVAGETRSLLACGFVDLGDRHARPLACEQDGGGTADARTGTGDECDLVGKACHIASSHPPNG